LKGGPEASLVDKPGVPFYDKFLATLNEKLMGVFLRGDASFEGFFSLARKGDAY